MPLRYIPTRKGWKYGKSGKLYTGQKARDKARAQGQAIELSKMRRAGEDIPVRASAKQRGYQKTLR